MVLAQREARNAVDRVGNDARALGKLAHREPLRGRLGAEARADLAFRIGVQLQADSQGGGGALPRVIVGCRADAAAAEHDIARGKAARERRGKPRRIVAEVMRPAEPQAALRQRLDEESKVLVLALADEYLVPDDESAEQSGGLFSVPRRAARRACRAGSG